MTTPLLIDTDVALGVRHEGRTRDIDDGFAIVEALNVPELELKGVTTVYGNGPHAEVLRVATELIDLKKVSVPVIPGASQALPQSAATPLPPASPAVRFLAEQLRAGPMAVAAIGPLTNIGLLAHHYPDAARNISQLIIVAGRSKGRAFYIGTDGPVRDFNFENDVRAAGLALGCGAPIILAGFELTSQVVITAEDLESIQEVGTATAQYFYLNSLAWCDYWTETFPTDAGFHPWDSAAIAWLRHPEYFATEQRGYRIREQATADTGAKEVQHWLECDAEFDGPKVTYCTGFAPGGAAGFVQDVVTTVY